ncbi:sigma D regulator [Endozoicomonas sp. SCSIO W0465]|uniref:sigma D regulator n=1 Tax=Endozoicomonas sp. SCSIO W0465 TaxID=2918516 RepID=UPI002075FED4|nr:sigma D regulator [Endozoicomonas sp. SCSIO W0465]USE36568.1 sigma D regulator [Endozoicomonas sp. SCSIO W0465]
MLEGCQTAKERWGGVSEIIDRWLNERQELIVLYCSINGMDQFDDDNRPVASKLKELCQILVDYASAGHFEVYEHLIQEAHEHNDGGIELAHTMLPKLEQNTSRCLKFNDSCESISSLQKLQGAVSELGETLEERFSLEDRMIETLHESHREKLANS